MTYLIAALILVIMFEMLLTLYIIVHIIGMRDELTELEKDIDDYRLRL